MSEKVLRKKKRNDIDEINSIYECLRKCQSSYAVH